MQQLSGLDASFLNMETTTQFGHVAFLMVFDPPSGTGTRPEPDGAGQVEVGQRGTGTVDAVRRTVAERLHLLPLFRRRLAPVPLGLDNPYWVDDTEFDLDFHIRHVVLPSPGDDHQLGELVSEIMSRPLDRARPLWELHVVDGLQGGETAMVTKLHHATIDGASGVLLLNVLLDASREGSSEPGQPAGPWTPERVPSQLELYLRAVAAVVGRPRALARWQLRAVRGLARTTRDLGFTNLADLMAYGVPGPLGKAVRAVNRRYVRPNTEVDVPPRLPEAPAPRTPFNRAITPERRFAFTTTSLSDAKKVKEAFGTTINDVVLTLCAGALRRYLHERGSLPTDPLLAAVPVSLRTGNESDPFSNQVSAVLASLATDLADPVARLRAIHTSMRAAKEMQSAMPADVLQDMAQFTPPALAARATRMTTRMRIADRMNPPFNLVVSNVPGPRAPLYLAGAQMKLFYPVSIVTDGLGLNMTVHSYLDHLDWGFIACPQLMPDVWDLTGYLHESMEELVKAADASRPVELRT